MDFISLLPAELQNNMRDIWSGCPAEIRNSASVIDVPKGYRFIVAGQECSNIYILVKGIAYGIDMQFSGTEYRFKEFSAGRFLGEFEGLSEIPDYVITVQAVTPCILCVLPTKQYLRWMKNDVHALYLRTKELVRTLTLQTQNDRRFFLSPCRERLIQAFAKWYEEAGQEELKIKKTRNELANAMGFVVRTVDRNINKLVDEGYITLHSGRITISNSQYQKLKSFLKENFAY